MTPLERWTDDRLDDLAERVNTLMRMQEKIAAMEIQLVQVHAQSTQCLDELRLMRRAQEVAEEHRLERDEAQRQERKQDRKWAIATIIAVLTLVIGALAVFLG